MDNSFYNQILIFLSTKNIEKKIGEEYEDQIKIPKPLLIEIFIQSGRCSFLKISLVSKQFYFLLKSENLWKKMLKETDLSEKEIEEENKSFSFQQIYRNTILGWDIKNSNQEKLKFKGNQLKHTANDGLAVALTKRKFIFGKENLIFTFEMKSSSYLTAAGVSLEGWYLIKIKIKKIQYTCK